MADKSSEIRAVVAEIQDSDSSREAVAREITAGALQTLRKARASGSRTAYAGAANLGFGYSAGYGGSWAALPSVLAQNSPLAVLQYTLSRSDKLALYRYFSRIDPMVASAVRLHTELPMSKVTISPPKGPNHDQNEQINKIYQNMSDRMDLEQVLMEITREYLICGDVFIWLEWDDEILEWKEAYCLPTEYVHTVLHPFKRNSEFIFFAKPLVDTAAVRRMTDRDLYLTSNDPQLEELFNEIQDDIPEELRASLDFGEGVPLNTDPSKGSCVIHIARNRTPNEQYGISLLEACVEVLFRLENLKNSQMQISSRNMSPKHLVYGDNIGQEQLNDLRAQIDLSLLEPDYVVCTNYPVDWKTIGANDRLLQVDAEYQTLREDLATGLGTTKEMLTGAATFGGQRITLEMMNQHYLCYRQAMINFVEKCIFRPVAEAKGHFFFEEIEEWVVIEPEDVEAGDEVIQQHDGEIRRKRIQENKVYNHSHLRFNRLSIRDNAEVYDQLFMLHQKGSLALKYLLDIHNIDTEENQTALLEDLGTVKDPTFNRLMETLYPTAAEEVIAKTNFTQRVIQGLNLDVISQNQGEPSPATPTMSGAGDLGLDVIGPGPGAGGGLGPIPPMDLDGAPPPGPDVTVTNELGPMPPSGDLGVEMSSQGSLGPVGTPPPGMPPAPTASARDRAVSPTPIFPGERLTPEEVSRLASSVKTSKWLQRDLSPRARKKLALKMVQKIRSDIESEQDA